MTDNPAVPSVLLPPGKGNTPPPISHLTDNPTTAPGPLPPGKGIMEHIIHNQMSSQPGTRINVQKNAGFKRIYFVVKSVRIAGIYLNKKYEMQLNQANILKCYPYLNRFS